MHYLFVMITVIIFIFADMKITFRIIDVWRFYRDGFKQMTWGRTLWVIILLKLFVIFVVLRMFFFKPILSGLNNEEKSERVGQNLETTP